MLPYISIRKDIYPIPMLFRNLNPLQPSNMEQALRERLWMSVGYKDPLGCTATDDKKSK